MPPYIVPLLQLPAVRRLALIETLRAARSDDSVRHIIFGNLASSPYLSEEQKAELSRRRDILEAERKHAGSTSPADAGAQSADESESEVEGDEAAEAEGDEL